MRKLKNKTATNKLFSLILLIISVLSIFIDGDIIGLLIGLPMAVALFTAKNNLIVKDVFYN